MKNIIYFYGKDCKRCNELKEQTNELLSYAKEKGYTIEKIDTDIEENLELASKHNVDNLPAIVIMKTVNKTTEKKITFDGDINFEHAKIYIDRRRMGLFDPTNPHDIGAKKEEEYEEDDEIKED